jgi:hypothetical protein
VARQPLVRCFGLSRHAVSRCPLSNGFILPCSRQHRHLESEKEELSKKYANEKGWVLGGIGGAFALLGLLVVVSSLAAAVLSMPRGLRPP